MKVRFPSNLGSRDATEINREIAESETIDFLACRAGEVVEVSDRVGQMLCERNLAVDAGPPVMVAQSAPPKPIKPPKPDAEK